MAELRTAIKQGGEAELEGYGDLSLTELLPALLTRYSETRLMIVAPTLPDQAADILKKWMQKQWARMDGRGNLNVIEHLTIIADLSKRKSPTASAWQKENPFPDRLTLIDRKQPDTAILLPDFAIIGPVNMQYGHHFIATATTRAGHVEDLWKRYSEKSDYSEYSEYSEKSEKPEAKETPAKEQPSERKTIEKEQPASIDE